MRHAITWLALLLGQAAMPGLLPAQQVVDRIVARVEDDIITLSEVRELGRYQQLVQGRSDSDDPLLAQLINQWIVNTEATAARFPRPTETEVNGQLDRLGKQFPSAEAYYSRLRELGLTAAGVRRLVGRQLYLARYLDYKFRPVAQVEASAIEKYYREQLVPTLSARGQTVPPLENVQEQIRELLVEREISERADRWLQETRSRLKIEFGTTGKGS